MCYSVPSPNSWSLARSISLTSPGAYTNNAIGNYQSYWINAFRDVNGNSTRDIWEPWGTSQPELHADHRQHQRHQHHPAGRAVNAYGSRSATPERRRAMSMLLPLPVRIVGTQHTRLVIPWVQFVSNDLGGATTFLTFPVNYSIIGLPVSNYWIRAFMDAGHQ